MAWLELESASTEQFRENLQTIFGAPDRAAYSGSSDQSHLRRQPSRLEAAVAAARSFADSGNEKLQQSFSRSRNSSMVMR